jgi:hypothetical protein
LRGCRRRKRDQAAAEAAGSGGGGGYGGYGGNIRAANMFSVRGLAARLGVPLAAAYAASESLRLSASLVEANETASHPERILRQFDHVGSQFTAANDPVMRQLSVGIAQISGREQTQAAFEAIPILGSAFRLAASASGFHGELEDEKFQATRAAQSNEFLREFDFRRRVEFASAQGDEAGAARINAEANQARLQNIAGTLPDLANRAARMLQPDIDAGVLNPRDPKAIFAALNEDDPALAAAIETAKRAQSALADEQKRGAFETGRAELRQSAEHAMFQSNAMLAANQAQAVDLLNTRAPGTDRRALLAQQRAEVFAFDRETDAKANTIKPEFEADFRSERSAQRDKLRADQRKTLADNDIHNEESLTSAQGAAQSARLRLTHDFFAAEMAEFEAAAKNELRSVEGREQSLIDATKASVDARRALKIQERQDQLQDSAVSTEATVQAAQLRSERRFGEASLVRFDAQARLLDREERRAGQITNPIERGLRLGEIENQRRVNEAERQEAVIEDQRRMDETRFALTAERDSAKLRIADRPRAANATNEVARARLRIENTDPRLRGLAIETETANLQSELHAIGPHSGGVSRAMTIDEARAASGFGVDMGGRERDLRLARQNIQQGIADLNKPIGRAAQPAAAQGSILDRLKDFGRAAVPGLFGPLGLAASAAGASRQQQAIVKAPDMEKILSQILRALTTRSSSPSLTQN